MYKDNKTKVLTENKSEITAGGKVGVVTGGAHGIGKAICEAFRKAGITTYVIDSSPNDIYVNDIDNVGNEGNAGDIKDKGEMGNGGTQPGNMYVGDIGDKETLERFAGHIIKHSGHVDYIINNAPPLMKGINECSWEEFQRAMDVGVTAPFYLTKLLMPYLAPGASVINISSSRDRMSQPQTESYTAAKGGLSALTHAMGISLAGKARVNSISPGWIDTSGSNITITGADALQQPAGRVGKPEDIAELVMFLISDKASFITGENITVDGGMTKLMIYHGEYGWNYG